jgi:hypothetical protein
MVNVSGVPGIRQTEAVLPYFLAGYVPAVDRAFAEPFIEEEQSLWPSV